LLKQQKLLKRCASEGEKRFYHVIQTATYERDDKSQASILDDQGRRNTQRSSKQSLGGGIIEIPENKARVEVIKSYNAITNVKRPKKNLLTASETKH